MRWTRSHVRVAYPETACGAAGVLMKGPNVARLDRFQSVVQSRSPKRPLLLSSSNMGFQVRI